MPSIVLEVVAVQRTGDRRGCDFRSAEEDPDAILWMLAANLIADTAALHRCFAAAAAAARAGRFVTFGMRPTAPETGYGYIEIGAALDDAPGVSAVARFIEKPDPNRGLPRR